MKKFYSTKRIADLSVDEITEKVVAAHQVLIELYQELAGQAHIPQAHELFQSLFDLEKHQLMQEMVTVHRFSDL